MPRKNPRKKKPSTPRIRPLEILLKRGDRQGYGDIIKQIALEGPELHREGSTILNSRQTAQGEWKEEKYRITAETISNVLEELNLSRHKEAASLLADLTGTKVFRENQTINLNGLLPEVTAEQVTGKIAEIIAGAPREKLPEEKLPEESPGKKPETKNEAATPEPQPPEEQKKTGQKIPALRNSLLNEEKNLMEELISRTAAITELAQMPQMKERVRLQAESIAFQARRAAEIILSETRHSGRDRLDENTLRMEEMTGDILGGKPPGNRAAQRYIQAVTKLMEEILEDLSEHTATLKGGEIIQVSIRNGTPECTLVETCPWPKCLAIDPRKCRNTGQSWRDCKLPDENGLQTKTKYFAAKRDDLFPWPPEWEEEIREIEKAGGVQARDR